LVLSLVKTWEGDHLSTTTETQGRDEQINQPNNTPSIDSHMVI